MNELLTCKQCNQVFHPKQSEAYKENFCSKYCADEYVRDLDHSDSQPA